MSDRPHSTPPSAPRNSVIIRSVWADNLETEFGLIRSIIDDFPIIAMDTEFPGVVYNKVSPDGKTIYFSWNSEPIGNYTSLKANVDSLKLIQLGLTFSDRSGNLPNLDSQNQYIWEFNFKDFNRFTDSHAPESIKMLTCQGIDFTRNLEHGIEFFAFGELIMSSGIVLNDDITWVTFHCPYDFGYLVKYLTGRFLPNQLIEFLNVVRLFFRNNIYDVKVLNKYGTNLTGGLSKVATELGVIRAAGRSHQAGSDSLLTLDVWLEIKKRYFNNNNRLELYANVLYGLELGFMNR